MIITARDHTWERRQNRRLFHFTYIDVNVKLFYIFVKLIETKIKLLMKDKTMAAVLAILLGGFGIHKFT